jgi:hypothetical protein
VKPPHAFLRQTSYNNTRRNRHDVGYDGKISWDKNAITRLGTREEKKMRVKEEAE